MNTADEFSTYCADLLEGFYDCVDRIVLNADFPLGQTGGGLRSGWRLLRGGDDDLDDIHLRDMAGRFSRRLHGFCAKSEIEIIEAQAGERKHQLAEPNLPSDPKFRGLFLVCRSGKTNTHYATPRSNLFQRKTTGEALNS